MNTLDDRVLPLLTNFRSECLENPSTLGTFEINYGHRKGIERPRKSTES